MLRSCASLVRGASGATLLRGAGGGGALPLRVPVRRWNQCTSYISLPPRHPHSLQESLAHGAFMMVVWLLPTFVGLSQIKVWKRLYLQTP